MPEKGHFYIFLKQHFFNKQRISEGQNRELLICVYFLGPQISETADKKSLYVNFVKMGQVKVSVGQTVGPYAAHALTVSNVSVAI